jgi:teichuronic acid biosynthesis glycosyltransferase TuaH
MNLVCIPYHDWRKIESEGSRTRDSHLIHHFTTNDNIDKVIVINRPTSYPELLINKKKFSIKGDLVFKKGEFSLYKLNSKLYVLDYISNTFLTPILKKRLWFFDSFANEKLISFFKECLLKLDIDQYSIFTNNIFSVDFVSKVSQNNAVFDAYDNLVFFPHNLPIKADLERAYNRFVDVASFWTTNSLKNVNYYKENYNQNTSHLIKNGVDVDTFQRSYPVPKDMESIPKPIIGFGGKITHLFDYELFNYCVDEHPDKNFVLVGQILDKSVFSKISKNSNVFYLGDKHYKDYPTYVTNFDIGIIPYVTNHLESGVDSIKMYEYIAAGLRVIGTPGAGMPDMADYIFIAEDKYQFSEIIGKALDRHASISLPEVHTWKYKANHIVELISRI